MANTESTSLPPDAPGRSHHQWETIPIRKPVSASWCLPVSQTDAKKLIDGFIPETMEDKWLIYSDALDTHGLVLVHLCRSWSMAEQMVLGLRPATCTTDNLENKGHDTGAVITEITWNEQQGGRRMGEQEAKEEAMELCNAILGCELPVDDSD